MSEFHQTLIRQMDAWGKAIVRFDYEDDGVELSVVDALNERGDGVYIYLDDSNNTVCQFNDDTDAFNALDQFGCELELVHKASSDVYLEVYVRRLLQ